MLAKNDNANALISGKLLTVYLGEGDIAKFTELLEYTQSHKKEFSLSPQNLDNLVELLVKEGRAKEARDWIIKVMTDQSELV